MPLSAVRYGNSCVMTLILVHLQEDIVLGYKKVAAPNRHENLKSNLYARAHGELTI
jgi:hypothetical protein